MIQSIEYKLIYNFMSSKLQGEFEKKIEIDFIVLKILDIILFSVKIYFIPSCQFNSFLIKKYQTVGIN